MGQRCIVWGAGNYGKRLLPMLKGEGYAIAAFCDSNTGLIGNQIDGYKIISVEESADWCRADGNLVVIIGIFDYDTVEEVRKIIQDSFPCNTEVKTGHSIQDAFENRVLAKYHHNMNFQWKVNLEEYFLTWIDNVMSEVEYWVKDVADSRGKRHEYNIRCRENDAFTHRSILRRINAGEIVLDIGCGLMSMYGEQLEQGGRIHLIPVDALAHFYNILNARIEDGRKSGYKCRFGLFEFLGNLFGRDYADYIIVNNALDHCIDPWRSLIECLYVLKQEGRMYLSHRRAEAVYEGWAGLHKWNIDCSDGDLLLWNKENAVNVTEGLKGFAEVHVAYDDSIRVRECQNVSVEIVKKKDFELSDFLDMQSENGILTKLINRLMEKLAMDSKSFFQMLEQAEGIR